MSTATDLRKAYKDKEAPIYEQCQMYRQRCDFLEQLCRDYYYWLEYLAECGTSKENMVDYINAMRTRMTDLGLLDGEQK